MIRSQTLPVLALLALFQLAGCATEAAIQRADAVALTPEQRKTKSTLHNHNLEATRASALFAREFGMPREAGGREVHISPLPDVQLTKVMMALDPLRPGVQTHVGWVEERSNLNNTFRVATYYDLSWTPIAYNNKDGFTGRRIGGELVFNPRIMTLKDAAAWVFGARGMSGVDTTKYAKTTVLREKDDWYTETTAQRGIVIVDSPPTVLLQRLTNEETVSHLARLKKENFRRTEAAKQRAIQLERLGEYNDFDDRKIETSAPSSDE